MEQLPKFELIDKYREETQQQLAKQKEYTDKVTQAQALVNALDIRIKLAIDEAVNKGADNRELLTQLKKEKAATLLELDTIREMKQAAAVNKRTVTPEDIQRGLAAYQNEYQSEVIAPALKQLRKVKEVYIAEYLEIMRKIKHFEEQAQAAYLTIKPNTIGKPPYSVGFGTQQNVNHKCITDTDLHEMARGQKPKSLEPIKKAVRNNDGKIVFVPVEEGEE
jgi:hypothetical protein